MNNGYGTRDETSSTTVVVVMAARSAVTSAEPLAQEGNDRETGRIFAPQQHPVLSPGGGASVCLGVVLLALLLRGRTMGVPLLRVTAAGLLETILQSLLLDLLVGELGQLPGGADIADVLAVALGEDEVDLLQTAARSLGVKEVHGGNEDGVHHSKEQVGAPVDVLDHDGCDHDDGKVEQPVRAGRHGVGLGTGADGRHLGRVQPGERQDTGTEEGHVQEQTKDGTLGRAGSARNQAGEDDDHGNHLAHHTTQEQLATTDLLNEEPGEGSEDGIDNHVDTTDQHRHEIGLIKRLLEQHGQVVDDSIASGQLLGDLGGRTDQHAAQVLSLAASEQIRVASTLSDTSTKQILATVDITGAAVTYASMDSMTSCF